MGQKRLTIEFYSPKATILIFLAITSLFYLGGCTTELLHKNWLDLADEKASPALNCEYWKIQRVVSAIKHKNGNITICLRIVNPVKTENPKLRTITFPFSDSTGEITAGAKLESSPSGCPLDDDWYPIEKAQKGCDKIDSEKVSSTTILPVEELYVDQLDVDNIDRNELYDLLNTYNKNQQILERIFEVKSNSSKHALFVYWPALISHQGVQPIIIAGTYEDKSTEAYRLLEFPYVIATVGLFGLNIFFQFVAPFM